MKRRTVECIVLILALFASLVSVSAFAAPKDEAPQLKMDAAVVNDFDSTYYNDGGTVINNFGIVYNNGGTVYNNGGTVFNNEGIVYNNGGIVFNNGAEVYNNGGTVHNNGGTVYEAVKEASVGSDPAEAPDVPAPAEAPAAGTEAAPVLNEKPAEAARPAKAEASAEDTQPAAAAEAEAQSEEQGYTIEMTGDYSRLADIDGLIERPDGSFGLESDGIAVIRAKAGLRLTDTFTTAGSCTMGSGGQVTLAGVNRNGRLTLKFKLEPPQSSLASGSYDDDKLVRLSVAADGAKILYTLDGSSPLDSGKEYKKPIELERSTRLRAVAVMEGAVSSNVMEWTYVFPELEEPEFRSAREGYAAIEPQPIILVNTGLDTVYVESVRLEGRDRDCFVLNTEKGGRVATGQRDRTSWTLAPAEGLTAGEYEAEIVFILAGGERLSEDVSFTVKK